MIRFDEEMINDLVTTYLNNYIEGRNDDVHTYVEQLWEEIEMATCDYEHGEINRVLKSFEICAREEDTEKNFKGIRGVHSADVAFIATHYGLLYGLVWAENCRLHFWEC